MYGIIQDILCAAEIGVPFLFAGRILEERKQKLPVRLLWFLCLGINMVMLILQRRDVMYSRWYLLVCIPLSAVLLKWRFRVRWRNAFLGMAIYFETLYVMDLFLVIAFGLIHAENTFCMSLLTEISLERVLILIIGRVGLLGSLYVLLRLTGVRNGLFRNNKLLIVIPVVQYMGLYQCDRIFTSVEKEPIAIRSFILFLLLYLILLIVLIILYVYEKGECERKITEERAMLLEQYCSSILIWNRERDVLLHDMKNHLLVLDELLHNGEQEKALGYLQKLSSQVAGARQIVRSGNSVVDAIVGAKTMVASEAGIEVQVIADRIEECFVDDQDWCSLLSNLLDNGIEACRETDEKRKIRLTLERSSFGIWIEMENSCGKMPEEDSGRLITTKKDKLNHGFGSESVRRVVEHYHGSLQYSYEDGRFLVQIILYQTG